jgi:hypothetical protein
MKKYVKVAFMAVVAAVAGYNVYQSQSVMNGMSDFALANVDALANDDEYNDSYIYKQPQTIVCDLREGNWHTGAVERICVFCAVPNDCNPFPCAGN